MALEAGYKRAFGAIFDSNVTTILAALILLNFDAGPIKGFALTLIIGMVSSLFTALFMTRTYFAWWAKRNPHKTLRMSHWIRSASFDFLGKARIAAGVTIATIVIGACLFFTHRGSMFGMDFTGGVSAAFELEQKESAADYAALVSQAFLERGANAQEFQVRSLSPPHHVRVLFAANAVRPELQEWMLSAIQTKGLALTSESQTALHQSWNSVSGQMSDAMRNNALLGLLLAFVSIFIYLMIRFETVFAAAASFCLGIEVLVTLGVMSILHACGVPVQIDLSTIAALMTIIGYCLNDIIIIFDRIREVRTGNRPFRQLINDSLNATLGRTAITSGITFCVLLLLVLLGGSSLLSFSLVMAIGVLIGTLSSWFIASPLLLSFSKDRKKSLV
jgi:SecD/SecF fusion protein